MAKPGLTSNSEVCADAMAGTFIAKSGLQEGYIMSKRIVLALALWFCVGEGLPRAEGGSIARIGESGEFLELEHQSSGQVVKDYLPLYRTGAVRYFSVGVGIEERQAVYPPFSLKLVFTAGGKPYLAGVGVTIQPAKEQRRSPSHGSRWRGPGCLSISLLERMTFRPHMASTTRR